MSHRQRMDRDRAAADGSAQLRAARALALEAQLLRARSRRDRRWAAETQERASELTAGVRAWQDGLGAVFDLEDADELEDVSPVLERVPDC